MRRTAPLAVAVLALLTAGCSDALLPDLRGSIEVNRARWLAVRPAKYAYTLARSCFCGPEALGPTRIVVEDGAVVSRTYVETGEPVGEDSAPLFPSIDGLFEILLEAEAQEAFSVSVDYDGETGVPVDAYIDYRFNTADEEQGWDVVVRPVVLD